MLKITIPAGQELYDEVNNRFIVSKAQTLELEHSLVSLAKWESKWHKPFLSREDKTVEESVDYIRCMTKTQNVDPDQYHFITNEHIRIVSEYIDNPMTATTFSKDNKPPSREVITAEIIYWWMIAFSIPSEYQKWHLNRLLTLIRVCNIKNEPPKKMSQRDAISRHRSLNAARRPSKRSKG